MTEQEKAAEVMKIAADVASLLRSRIDAGDEEAVEARRLFITLVEDLNRPHADEEDKAHCRLVLSLVRYAYLAGKPRNGGVVESSN